MPSATARRLYEDQIPSFMSVFDLGADAMGDQETVTVVDPKIISFPGSNFDSKRYSSHAHPHPNQPSATVGAAAPSTLPCDHSHRHHDSTSTQASESADSSPTTTMSCTDSSSLSDPSPSSSPDSPVNLVPLSAFPGPSFGGFSSRSDGLASLSVDGNGISIGNSNSLRFNNGADGVGMGIGGNGPTRLERPMTSPSPRRARNMKGLSIQPPFVSPTLSSTQSSEPTSPSFIKPQIPAMKRKPSQLSLKTGTRELITSTTIEVPQSPSLSMPPIMQRRALKHSTSSPHILSSIKSATFGPPGGMTFSTVLERNETGLSEFLRPSKPTAGPVGYDSTILEEDSPIRTQIASRAAFEFEPFHENENNEDQKTPGYPDGPIAIYGDNVYLYLEPTAEEAARFDVVINVAREVRNPFKATGFNAQAQSSSPEPQPQQRESKPAALKLGPVLAPVMEHEPEVVEPENQNDGTVPMVFEPVQNEPAKSKLMLKAPPTLSLTPAEPSKPEPGNEEGTPTTPKATHSLNEPEYIHMPWDHNTDISQDLIMLCEKIERKTKAGKKVLIHCQQGASRSASLIIAYGIWQNPDLSVNDAYYAAQSKSRWISPNMRLMYCLQDFQKEMGKKRLSASSLLRPRSGRSPTKHRAALSVDAIELAPKEPLSAPLPAEDNAGNMNRLSPERSPMRPRGNSTPQSRDGISPGPSSAPSAFSWDMKEDAKDPQRFGRFDFGFSSTVSPPQPTTLAEAPQLNLPMKLGQPPKLEPLPSFGMRGSTLLWPENESMSFSKPPPSPGLLPGRQAWPGSESESFGKPPPSPGLRPLTLSLPGRGSDSSSKPPPSPGLRPLTLSLPGRGSDSSNKPPPSPGFAAHRFGKFPTDLAGSSTTASSTGNVASSGFPLYSPGFPRPRSSCSGGLDSILAQNMSSPADPKSQPVAIPTIASINDRSGSHKPEMHEHTISFRPVYAVEEPLMSPRAETMTNNPLHDNMADISGMRFVEVPPTPSEGLFSPRESMFPRDPFYPFGRPTLVADPRSPPTKGETPIVRSIDELM